jgi:hypothetical protein
MSSGGEPELGSGGFYGGDSGGGGGAGGLGGLGGGMGPGLGGLGGLLGMGGTNPLGAMHPRGSFGLWPSCGCGSLIIILAGILLVCGGCLQLLNQ